MSKGLLAKVMKYELQYLDGCGEFRKMQEQIWQLQRQTRDILNRTIQIAFHWDYLNRENYEKTGEYLDLNKETGYKTLDGYVYNQLKAPHENMAASNLNATIQKAWSKYKSSKTDILRGSVSVPSYKKDQPLMIDKKAVKLSENEAAPTAELTLFSGRYKKEHGFSGNVRFCLVIKDGTQRTIFQKLLNGEYGLGGCQLIYDRHKWFLLMTYRFSPQQQELDPDKILGVDLGECYAIYASSTAEYGSLKIDGGNVTAYAKKLEARRRSLQRQAVVCGEGRIGHGTKTRVGDVFKAQDRIANFRATENHRYSKALVEYAVKHGFGTIQMEDLSGIKEDTKFPKFLRHWTYYDLQTKIEAKAKEQGIKVIKVNPQDTSQRCSKCGNIDRANRPRQERFCCTSCGFTANADFNASQNLSIKGIDKIIKERNAKGKES